MPTTNGKGIIGQGFVAGNDLRGVSGVLAGVYRQEELGVDHTDTSKSGGKIYLI
jgi:hypothetical protein